jgi:hypothetical protein
MSSQLIARLPDECSMETSEAQFVDWVISLHLLQLLGTFLQGIIGTRQKYIKELQRLGCLQQILISI